MKRILFVIPEYSHGGTNKSLENLLALIDHAKYNISIYCLYEDGGDYYRKVFAPYILKKSNLYYWLHDNKYTRKIMGLYNKLTKRDNFDWLYRREARWLQKKYQFDVTIGFQEGTATLFAQYFNNYTKTIAWYHCPYIPNGKAQIDSFKNNYRVFDKIVCVSNTFVNKMAYAFPEMASKFIRIYNSLNIDSTKRMSTETPDIFFEEKFFSILSVGRFAKKSQFHKIPKIANDIIKKGVNRNFKWYIIAAGHDYEMITKDKIFKHNVQENVILLGAKDNPYPYMRQADVVVCTSDSESFSYVIAEAKSLHTPVISNNFPVAYEVVDEQTGWIASLDDMPQLIARLINDENGEYSKKKKSIMSYEYSNKEILKQIDELLSN